MEPHAIISSTDELIREIESIPESEKLIFRGHERFSYVLLPSLYRNRAPLESWEEYLEIIGDSLDELEKLGVIENAGGDESEFHRLAIAQHFGIPTPILDWTRNPRVALFFATAELTEEEDGEVIGMYGKPQALPEEGYVIDGSYPFLRIPPRCPRHQAQDGLFTFSPFMDADGKPIAVDEPHYGSPSTDTGFRFRIPHRSKRRIRRDLDEEGINSKILFPDHEGVVLHANWRLGKDQQGAAGLTSDHV